MGVLSRLFGKGVGQTDYSSPDVLRAVYNDFLHQWPINSQKYIVWKPASLLPAPKWAVKRALKLGYEEWDGPIDWTVYSGFFMEFADLAAHLSDDDFAAIANFRTRYTFGFKEDNAPLEAVMNDPLLHFYIHSNCAAELSYEDCAKQIIHARGFDYSPLWGNDGGDVAEIHNVRRILVESATELATLIQEWRFYILSIDRYQYREDST